MVNISPITSEEQDILLQKKLDERLNYSLLTDQSSSPDDYLENQAIFIDLCRSSCKFFIDNVLWLQDPEQDSASPKEIPFLLWDYQEPMVEEIVNAINDGDDLIIEKCRKVGATWVVLAVFLWGWHFHKWELLVGGRKLEDCDKRGDIGTLFGKLRFMIQRLPLFIFPTKLDNFTDKVALLIHPEHQSSIAGEGNNANFGRSDRRKAVFLDEFASWETTEVSAFQGLSATTKCRIACSTPNRRGTNCFFYELVQDARKSNKRMLSISWNLHPKFRFGYRSTTESDLAFKKFLLTHTSDWLEHEIERAVDQTSVAQEILIDYSASMSGMVYPEFDPTTQISDSVEYDYSLPLYVSWDFGLDATALVFYQPYKNEIRVIDEYVNDGNNEGASIYHYLDILDSKGYKMAIHYGDPFSGENRSLTSGLSPASILRKHGIIFKCQRARINNRIQAARAMVPRLVVSSRCTLFIDMMQNWQMRKPKSGTTTSGLVPDHSPYSHIGESYSYFAYNYNKSVSNNSPRPRKVFTPSSSGVML